MEAISCSVRIRLLTGHIYAASKADFWAFNGDFHLVYSTSIHQEALLHLLEISGGLDYLRSIEGGCRRPVMLGDSLGMVWVAEHYFTPDGDPDHLIVFGPVFLSHTSPQTVEKALSAMNFPLQPKLQLMRILETVPVMPFSMVRQYAMMIHHCFTEELNADFIAYEEDIILFQQGRTPENDPEQTDEEKRETAILERARSSEQQLLQCVQQGSRDYAQVMKSADDTLPLLLTDTGSSLRDGKNTIIILTAKCCVAAMEGGVSTYAAKQLEADYIKKAEACATMAELTKVNRQMLDAFIEAVRRAQTHSFLSPAIREACDFIRAHVTHELALSDIADHVGYTEYYFTRKFTKEMGKKVQDFIKEAKIEHAKIQLLTTLKSIQEISDSLNFSNRNYFSKVFREVTGITPAAFRNQQG